MSKRDCAKCKNLPEGKVIQGHDHRENLPMDDREFNKRLAIKLFKKR